MVSILVLHEAKKIMGTVYGVPTVVLDVLKIDIMLGIVLLEMVNKFLPMFQRMMLQR